MAEMRERKTLQKQQLTKILLSRELVWSNLPHTMRKGTMGFLEIREAAFWVIWDTQLSHMPLMRDTSIS